MDRARILGAVSRKQAIASVVAGMVWFALAACGAEAPASEYWQRTYDGILNGRSSEMYQAGFIYPILAFVDIDADGDQDLYIGGIQRVSYLRNDGTASSARFTVVQIEISGMPADPSRGYLAPAFADIDADGDQDVFVGNYGAGLYFLRNDGSPQIPSFVFVTSNYQGLTVGATAKPTFADIDNDGDVDLFVGKEGSDGRITFYRNDGTAQNASFTFVTDTYAGIVILFNTSMGTYPIPRFCDIDGDGDSDLFIGEYNYEGEYSRHVYFYRNDGTRETPAWTYVTNDYFGAARGLFGAFPAFVDLDGDGDFDAVVGNGEAEATYYENQGSPQQPLMINKGLFLNIIDPGCHSVLDFADIDGDGDEDLFFGNGHTVRMYENVGSPSIPAWVLRSENYVQAPPPIVWHKGTTFGDLDGDGDLDMLLIVEGGVPYDPIYLYYYRNDGDVHSAVWVLQDTRFASYSAPSDGYIYPRLFDIDHDGDLDLFVGETGQGGRSAKLHFFQNTGTAQAHSFVHVTDSYVPLHFRVLGSRNTVFPDFFDIDHDGDPDLLIACSDFGDPHGGKGWINFYRNDGTNVVPFWTLVTSQWNGWTLPAAENALRLADIDSDGDKDLFISDYYGGLQFWTNMSPKLDIRPRGQTVLAGQQINFTVWGSTSTLTWSFVRNSSSATLASSTGSYTAGTRTRAVDIVSVRDTNGLAGQAAVNIISASDLSASGKAVVMAGTYGVAGDPLWGTTNNLAHFIYRTLLYRGFSKQNIYYLNPVAGQDVDGNGNSSDDIDAPSTLANLQTALTTFAAGSPELFVYLIDHGGEQSGGTAFIRCNVSEVLTAAQLDTWLDALQSSGGATTLTVVVDCCQSGSFLDELQPPAGKKRIVVASTKPLGLAFFAVGGLISFTESFVNALYMGFTVGQAFRNAAGAMDRYQQPMLDDNGDGIYNKDADGALADAVIIGARYIAGADRPQIGRISPNQMLTGGETAATIWASDVSSVYPIQRVWATVIAPDFVPTAQLDPSSPVVGLPEIVLTWNAGQSHWEATTNTFTQTGAYRLNIYARDVWNSVAYPKQTYIYQMEGTEKVIIVASDGDYDDNSPWEFTNYLANYAYRTALARWIRPSSITYLNSNRAQDVDGNGAADDVDATPTKSAFFAAFTAAVGATQLTVYLAGRGWTDTFKINASELVTAAELDAWLDALQNAGNTKVVVILDFWKSGSFLDNLQPPSGKKRVVVASCSYGQPSLNEAWGLLSFSQYFLNYIFNGWNVYEAFDWARYAVEALTEGAVNPLLDDDGDGDGDKWDGAVAQRTWIGAAFVTGADLPIIGDCPTTITLSYPQRTATLWAANVSDPDGIAQVWAIITPPNYDPAHDAPTTAVLAYATTTHRHETVLGNFDKRGAYRVTYYARDRHGDVSLPRLGAVVVRSAGTGATAWRLYR